MTTTVFIDGEVGTTGLQIRARLEGRQDCQIVSLPEVDRKNPTRRAEILNNVDLAILCLPDAASRDAVQMIKNPDVRVIDASSAHRVEPGWVYGMPEYVAGQRELIAGAKRVTNPGCYACSSVAIINPLVRAGVIPASLPVSINAISGYSGGGRQMIERFEKTGIDDPLDVPFFVYGLGLQHKHVNEILVHSGLDQPPVFVPSVGRFKQGMIVQIPLSLRAVSGDLNTADLQRCYEEHYQDSAFVSVASQVEIAGIERLEPEILNDTNQLRLHVFGNDEAGQAVVMAVLDNLGKGASGQAVQNMNLMFGLPETTGLV